MDKLRLYAVIHKKYDNLINDRIYIGVGNNKEIPNVSIYDNLNDNISQKNPNYCELTAQYWIWKNDFTSEYIGFEHYRRFFYKKFLSINKYRVYSKDEIEKLINTVDIILPQKSYTKIDGKKVTVEKHYEKDHYLKDLLNCEKVINELYPEYSKSFNKVIHDNKISFFNMIICKKELFNEYSNWLFNIFDNLEKITDISTYDSYQKRIYGFLSERLLNVWVEYNKNKIKIKYLPVCNIEEKPFKVWMKNIVKCLIR